MSKRGRDRRRNSGEFRVPPRRSAANLLVLTVVGVMAATAAATVLTGGGLEDRTPHGQLLTALRDVAERQESYREEHGRFAGWVRTLEMPSPEGVELTVLKGTETEWEAVARHPVGLTCSLLGRVEAGRLVRDEPICFTSATR